MSDDRSELLAALDQVADGIDGNDTRRAELYAQRLELWQKARAMEPPITQKVLAAHSRVTEPAVIQQLKKAREAVNG